MYFSHRSYKQNIELISLKFMEISRALCNSPLLYKWYITLRRESKESLVLVGAERWEWTDLVMSAGRLWSSWVWQEKPNKARREAWGESRTLARAMADQIERLQILNKLQPHHHVATLSGSRTDDLRGSSKGDGRGQQSSHSALVRDADWDCGDCGALTALPAPHWRMRQNE